MTRRFAIAGGVLLVVVLAAVAVWQVRASKEPVYEGKKLGDWMDHHVASSDARPPYGSGGWKKAHEAIERIGASGIPTLLSMIEATDGDLRMRLKAWAISHGVLKGSYRSAWRQNDEALYAFEILGTNAVSAVPGLIRIYREAKNPYSQMCAALALGHIGKGAAAALPVLIENFTHTNREVRFYAVSAVINIRADPELIVPALRSVLDDPKMETCWNAIVGLSTYGRKAEAAVPDLLRVRKREMEARNLELTKQVDVALWRIAPEKTAKAVVVEQGTQMVVNGVTTEALELSLRGDRKTLIRAGTRAPISRQSWNSDPRGKVELYRVAGKDAAGAKEVFLGEWEVMGLPPEPEDVHAYVVVGVAAGNVFICARDVNSNELLEVRRVD